MPPVSAIPSRLCLGPGPSPVPPRVLAALAHPTIGHLDPAFLALMDEVRDGLRHVFATTNAMTLAMSGTGSAGMETVIVNLVEPGDRVLVGV
ncbi:MAG: aminotransferase class V-fold PLP-dependent enzyme, partial [Kofleriaceae bacterium]